MASGSFWDRINGFPAFQTSLLCIIRLGEPMVFTSIFAYIFFMIQDFKIAKTPAEIATYAGYLLASFAIFQFLFCVQYAQASTKFGRKPVLLFGVLGTGVSSLLFGFSQSFTMAMIARSMMGALNGNIAVLRVAIGEVAVEKRHESLAFSMLAMTWGVGSIIGPLIGSSRYLTRPKALNNLNILGYDAFVEKFPYALANIVLAGYLFTSFVLGLLFLEETSVDHKNRRDYGLELGDIILGKLFGKKMPTRSWTILAQEQQLGSTTYSEASEDERNPLIPSNQVYSAVEDQDREGEEDEEDEEVDEYNDPPLVSLRFGEAARRRYSSEQLGPVLSNDAKSFISTNLKQSFTKEVLTFPVIQTVTSNFLLCFHAILYSEFYPVLLASPYLAEQLKFPFVLTGGFEWNTQDIGHLLSTTGIMGTLTVLIVFPILDHHLKSITILRISFVLVPFAYFVIPYILFATKYATVSLYAASLIQTILVSISFASLMILIHRASPKKHRPLINGANLSLNSLARGISPLLFGHFMTWCDERKAGEVPWIVLSIIALLCLIQSFTMKDYSEDEDEDGQERGDGVIEA